MSDADRPQEWASLGAAWRSDDRAPGAFETVDLEAIRARSATFARKIRRRNALELLGCAIVVAAGLDIAREGPRPLVVAGGIAMVLGAVVVGALLWLRGRNERPPAPDAPTREVLAHERRELERQARLLERVWLWYLAPLLPCVGLIYADRIVHSLERGAPLAVAEAAALFVATLLFFVFVGWLNGRAARRLRGRLGLLSGE